MTIRVDDENAAFVDEQAVDGTSRADVINRALARERRRVRASADAEVYRQAGEGSHAFDSKWLASNAAKLGAKP